MDSWSHGWLKIECDNSEGVILIHVDAVGKIYQGSSVPVEALKNVAFTVNEGEFLAIVGPSGSGKSTLLNILGGLDQPSRGTVEVDGVVLGDLTNSQLVDFRLNNVGFVFQSYNLIPVFTAQENVEFVLQLQGHPASMYRKRSLELLEWVGLLNRASHKPAQLSGGEQQRVAVARALASSPRFVLADEPTANLDTHAAETLLNYMHQLNQSMGTTFIFSTHDGRVIQRSRRMVELCDGQVVRDEPRECV